MTRLSTTTRAAQALTTGLKRAHELERRGAKTLCSQADGEVVAPVIDCLIRVLPVAIAEASNSIASLCLRSAFHESLAHRHKSRGARLCAEHQSQQVELVAGGAEVLRLVLQTQPRSFGCGLAAPRLRVGSELHCPDRSRKLDALVADLLAILMTIW